MRLPAVLVATAVAILWGTIARAGDPVQAMNSLSHEYARCAAYFLVVSIALENSKKLDLARSYSEVSDLSLEYARTAASQAGLLPETTQARFEMEFLDMSNRIAGNTSNIAILGRDYATPCQIAMEDVQSRVDYWLAQ